MVSVSTLGHIRGVVTENIPVRSSGGNCIRHDSDTGTATYGRTIHAEKVWYRLRSVFIANTNKKWDTEH
jgi:hypothetical protein